MYIYKCSHVVTHYLKQHLLYFYFFAYMHFMVVASMMEILSNVALFFTVWYVILYRNWSDWNIENLINKSFSPKLVFGLSFFVNLFYVPFIDTIWLFCKRQKHIFISILLIVEPKCYGYSRVKILQWNTEVFLNHYWQPKKRLKEHIF